MELQVSSAKGFLGLFAAGALAAILLSFLLPLTSSFTAQLRSTVGGTTA